MANPDIYLKTILETLTQEQAAAKLEVSAKTVYNWANGVTPRREARVKIQELYDEITGNKKEVNQKSQQTNANEGSSHDLPSRYIASLERENARLSEEMASLKTIAQNQIRVMALLKTLIQFSAKAEANIEGIQKKVSAKQADKSRVNDLLLEANNQYKRNRDILEKAGTDAGIDTLNRT